MRGGDRQPTGLVGGMDTVSRFSLVIALVVMAVVFIVWTARKDRVDEQVANEPSDSATVTVRRADPEE